MNSSQDSRPARIDPRLSSVVKGLKVVSAVVATAAGLILTAYLLAPSGLDLARFYIPAVP